MKVYKYFLIAIAVILIDQISKLLVYKYMYIHQEVNVIGEWFRLHYLLNPGMAFGIRWQSEFGKLALTIFRIGAMFGITYYLWRMAQKGAHNGFLICMSLILGGAIGNVVDSTFYGVFLNNAPLDAPYKWFHGQVIDMLYFPLFHFYVPEWFPFRAGEYFEFFSPVFNIADSSIFIGVVSILIFQHSFFTEREAPAQDAETHLEETIAPETIEKENHYRTFFGEASEYYMYVKRKIDHGESAGFNFFSFLLGPVWFICRKMYVISAMIIGLQLAVAFFAPTLIGTVFTFVIALILGFSGNSLYVQRADSVIEEVMNNSSISQENKNEILRTKGGVTYVTSIVIGIIYVVLYFLSFI